MNMIRGSNDVSIALNIIPACRVIHCISAYQYMLCIRPSLFPSPPPSLPAPYSLPHLLNSPLEVPYKKGSNEMSQHMFLSSHKNVIMGFLPDNYLSPALYRLYVQIEKVQTCSLIRACVDQLQDLKYIFLLNCSCE